MSVVSLLGVNVMSNPAKFTDKYEFEITFECLETLQKGAFLQIPFATKRSTKMLDANRHPIHRP